MAAQHQSALRQRRRLHRLRLLAAALMAGGVFGVDAYVTSGLPGHKHRSWLKQMTRDIVEAPPGELTAENLAAAPQLMAVWAENPYVPSSSRWSPPPGDWFMSTSPSSTSKRPQHPSSAGPVSPPPSTSHDADHGLECALEVEALLKRLVDERVAAGRDDVSVTTEAYNAVLFGWANSGGGAFAAERAEQILMQMQAMYEAGDNEVRPDVQSFRAVLLAWSNASRGVGCNESQSEEKCQVAQRAERVLEYMADLDDTLLDSDCFEVVLRLWSNSGLPDAPIRAERLLAVQDRMYLLGNEACRLRASSFDEVLMAWCRHTSVTTAASKSSKGDSAVGRVHDGLAAEAPRRAETILSHMESLSDAGTIPDATPNVASYTSVVSAWGRTGGQRGAHRATKILKRLEKRYFEKRSISKKDNDEHGDGKDGWRNSDEVSDLRPDTTIYNICIDAWVKAQTKDAYRQARSILNHQIAAHRAGVRRCRPDVYSYTLVLHACAAFAGTMKEKRRPFRVAKATFEELLEAGVAPNHVTYGIMMKACARLLPKGSPERERFARELFGRARREGCVGKMVVCRLREAVCTESYREMMGGATKNKLPPEWTRNVPEAEKRQNGKNTSSN